MVSITVPPDKSISHRSAIFSSLAKGETRIKNFLLGQDCLSTLEVLRDLGVDLEVVGNTVLVRGKGKFSFSPPTKVLYAGNSGTTMRLMAGVLAGQKFASVLDGDSSLRRRPMRRIIEPLSMMGARIKSQNGFAPLEILPSKLKGIEFVSPIASAQVKSAVLLAGLHAQGKTYYREVFPSRDHTERMLGLFGVRVERENGFLVVSGDSELTSPGELYVPGDISSASFFVAYGLLAKGMELKIRGVGINPSRTGMLNVVKRMGGRVEVVNEVDCAEPYGDLVIKSSNLVGVRILPEEVPRLIDELPIIAVLSAFAEGKSVFEGVQELRVKECDRVEAIRTNLENFGVKVRVIESGDRLDLEVEGRREFLTPRKVLTWHDHRIAMAFGIMLAVLGMDYESILDDLDCVGISYPEFWKTLSAVTKGVDYEP